MAQVASRFLRASVSFAQTSFCKLRLDEIFGLIEYCHRCGRRVNQVWMATDKMWSDIVGISGGRGVRCIDCFDLEAAAKDVALHWQPYRSDPYNFNEFNEGEIE